LLATVRKPDEQADEQADEQGEVIAGVVWDAMGDMAVMAESAVRHSGVMLRFEAIRTEIDQVRYTPLEPYCEQDRVHEQCQPWQQMVTFFVRTQQEHTWQTPPYRFNNRQKKAFEQLMAAAQQEVASRETGDDSGSDDGDSSKEEFDTDHETTMENGSRRDMVPGGMKTVQLAALEFCIELLNQTMQQRETEMALVCALAVLGVRPTGKGFRDEQTFPSVLSSIIKVAHFMVVLRAEQLTGHIGEDEWAAMDSPCTFEDSGYESEQARCPKRTRGT
jgi:hypothetical protein